MRTVADTGDLRRLAASLGATAHAAAGTFNAQGARMAVLKAQPVQETPPPAPAALAAPSAAPSFDAFAAMQSALLGAIARMGVEMASALRDSAQAPHAAPALPPPAPQPTPAPPPPQRVEFAVMRDADGLMTAVQASAGGRSLVLDIVRDRSQAVAELLARDGSVQFALMRDADKNLATVAMTRNNPDPKA